MKKSILLIAFTLAFSGLAWGKSVPQSTTVTTATTDPTNTNQTIPWLSGPDGKLHQLHTSNAGDLAVGYVGAATALTAQASTFTKFTLLATTATAQYITVTAASYILLSNPGGVDIVADWSTSASTPANLSNTGAVRVPAGGQLAQSVQGGGMVLGYSWLIYSNPNPTSPSAQLDF